MPGSNQFPFKNATSHGKHKKLKEQYSAASSNKIKKLSWMSQLNTLINESTAFVLRN